MSKITQSVYDEITKIIVSKLVCGLIKEKVWYRLNRNSQLTGSSKISIIRASIKE
jgi:hypothetical protein